MRSIGMTAMDASRPKRNGAVGHLLFIVIIRHDGRQQSSARGAIVLGDVSNDVGTIFVIRDCGAGNLLPRANIRLIIAVTCSKRNEVGFLIFYILLIRDFSRLGSACCNRGNLQPIMARTFDITKRLFTNERITHIVRIRTAFEHDKH